MTFPCSRSVTRLIACRTPRPGWSVMSRVGPCAFGFSAMTGEGLELLYDAMAERLAEDVVHHYVKARQRKGGCVRAFTRRVRWSRSAGWMAVSRRWKSACRSGTGASFWGMRRFRGSAVIPGQPGVDVGPGRSLNDTVVPARQNTYYLHLLCRLVRMPGHSAEV